MKSKYKLVQAVCNNKRCVCDIYQSYCSKTVTWQIREANQILAEFLDYPRALKVFQGMATK